MVPPCLDNKISLSGKSLKHIVIMLLPLQGATTPTRDTQGVATLALTDNSYSVAIRGWEFCIIGRGIFLDGIAVFLRFSLIFSVIL